MSKHKIQGRICLTCTIKRVQEIIETNIDYETAKRLVGEAQAKILADTEVKWAIEDEATREQGTKLIAELTAAKYVEGSNK